MPSTVDKSALLQQIAALMAELAEAERLGDEARRQSPSAAAKPRLNARALAVVAPAPSLTEQQRRICIRIVNVFETGKAAGDYSAVSIFHDGPNQIRQVTYGRAQTTEYGNLHELISDYVAANGIYSAALAPYLDKIGVKTGTPASSPLVDDQTFLNLLRSAGSDPAMRRTQDAFFDRVYFQPALNWASQHGFSKALSVLVIYDSFIHSGGIRAFLLSAVAEPTPVNGGDERTWVAEYLAARQNWLANNSNPAVRGTVYRTKDLMREVNRNNWDLAIVPISANGTPVDGAPDRAPATTASSEPEAATALDEDPASPAIDEVSETAGYEAARTLANLGAAGAVDAHPVGALAVADVSFDLARAQAFLDACESTHPPMTYGLGKKAPWLGAVPGRDFTQIDCSGFVREAVRRATTPTLAFPDGSVVQHDWVRTHGFETSTVADAGNNDGIVRIAFLSPRDSGEGIGHVALVSGGKTLESRGHKGPDSRVWNGDAWQARTSVYVFARGGRLASASGAESFAAAEAAVPAFTVRRGHRYAADIVLGFLESFGGNDQIASALQGYGFVDVVVTGSGATRHAEATWGGADTSAPIDPRLHNVKEIPLAAAGAAMAPVAAPAVIATKSTRAAGGGPGNIFSAADLPKFHDGLLAVRMRPEAMASPAAAAEGLPVGAMALAALVKPQTIGMSALSFFDRAGKVKVTPLRSRDNAAGPAPRMPAATALAFAPARADPAGAADGVSFIELQDDRDVEQLHQELAKDPTVAEVTRVAARYLEAGNTAAIDRTAAAVPPPEQQLLWNLRKIFWPEAHALPSFCDANEVTVAVLDTGVDQSHPNLDVDAYYWNNPDIGASVSDQDLVGHGTHVSGIITALLKGDVAVRGVCRCRLIVHKIFNDTPKYYPELGYYIYSVDPRLYRRALVACVDNPVDVMNLSIGGPQEPEPAEQSLFDQLLDAGTIICAAMGNERKFNSPVSYPAAIPGVIAVGASALDDGIAEFSNSGAHIAVSAPGKAIWSTLPRYSGQIGFAAERGPDGSLRLGAAFTRQVNFDAWNGTSMAAPHVSGAAALLVAKSRAAGNKLGPRQVRDMLMASADKVAAMNGADFSVDFGAGRLNLSKLLR